MPRGGRIGPPHITRSRQSFSALDMFNQLTSFPEVALGGMIFENGDNMIFENGDNMIHEDQ